ncbi:MAG: hypothetical protein MH204_00385 [Fimbriimonadaceae bacterium]|nr:hypothetical protein [Fimbriimonadaceae bacterium]
MRARVLLPMLALTALAASAPTQPKLDLTWKPQVGKVLRYDMALKSAGMEMGGVTLDLDINIRSTSKTTEIKDGIVTQEQRVEKLTVLLNGNDVTAMGPPMSDKPTILKMKLDGTFVSMEGPDSAGSNQAIQRLMSFRFPTAPIGVGESWTNELKNAEGKVEARTKYTLVGQEMLGSVNSYKIDYAFSMLEGTRPMGSVGSIWLDAQTLDMLYMRATINDVSFAEGMPPMNMSMTMSIVP